MESYSSVEDIVKASEQLALEEKRLEGEIEDLLRSEDEFDSLMKKVQKKLPTVQYLLSDVNQLAHQISFTSSLSYNVSFKVRKLDLAKNRVSQCLQRIGDILDLKYCVDGIYKALNNEDYEQGAAHIHRFLSMDESVLRRSAEDESGNNENGKAEVLTASSIDEAFAKLHDAEQKLKTIVMKKFDEAVKDDDVASVERFFKIFPLLNQHTDGLQKFSSYLSAKVSRDLSKLSNGGSVTHINQLAALFEAIAKTIDVHQPLVETYYGPGNLINLVELLQQECDARAKKIINDFKITKDFANTAAFISKSLKVSSSNAVNKMDPRQIDALLSETMLIDSRAANYFKFITKRTVKDIEVAYVDDPKRRDEERCRLEQIIRNCELSHTIHELNGTYVLLEEYFLRESATKAIQLDDFEAGTGSLTSNMLDDVFFIVKKCVRRALFGGNSDVLCAIINHSVSVLENCFYEALSERLRYGYPSATTITGALDLSQAYNVLQTGRYLQSYSDIEKTKVMFLTTLNNLDVACDYIKTLRKDITLDSRKIFDPHQTQHIEKFESCLADFLALTGKFQSLVLSGVSQLCSSVLQPRIKAWVDAFTNTSHILTEDELSRYEASDGLRPFTQNFMVNIDALLKSLSQTLTVNNYTNLISVFSTECTQRFEAAVTKCQYNKLGGFQFDRELRAIMNYLSSATTWSIRDKFARLKQITVILNLETSSEIGEYFNANGAESGNTPWRLTPKEVRQIMKLRVDFTPEEVCKIKL